MKIVFVLSIPISQGSSGSAVMKIPVACTILDVVEQFGIAHLVLFGDQQAIAGTEQVQITAVLQGGAVVEEPAMYLGKVTTLGQPPVYYFAQGVALHR